MDRVTTVMNTIQASLKSFESNPIIPLIASGGLTVWVITNLKVIFATIKRFVVSLISFNLFNSYEDNYYTKNIQLFFNEIVSESPTIWERTKQMDLNDHDTSPANKGFIPKDVTYGFSIRIMYGKIVFCYRSQKAEGQKLMINTDLQVFFARKTKFIEKLTADIERKRKDNEKDLILRNTINVSCGNANISSALKNKRKLDSIFTNNDEHMQLYDDIMKFINNKETYAKMNYPYKYAALLAGKPGTGKSSTILAIASALNRDVDYINLATTSVNNLMDHLNCRTNSKIFVFEDVDALNSNAFNERAPEKKTNGKSEIPIANQTCVINTGNDGGLKVFTMSLSDLLNITDGLLSSDGAICIFTTNHIEKLDSALLRAGRMNKIIEYDYINHETANRMIEAYLGKDARVENLKDDIKPAELQEEILNILLKIKDEKTLLKFAK